MKALSIEGWKLELNISIKKVENAKTCDNCQYELDYKAEFDEYMKSKKGHEENCYKVYVEIWERCNKAMKFKNRD